MSFGRLTNFNATTSNWTSYVERAEMCFIANDVKPELWLPTLIAAMGDESYELLSNLTSPKKPSDLSYVEVVKILGDHLQPKTSFMAERYRFRQRRQNMGESVSTYITELKKLSKNCEFKNALEDNLRDQLVCGLRCDVIRQRLFAKDDLDYGEAVKLACAMEAAERDAAAVEQGKPGEADGAGALHAVGTARAGPRGAFAARSQRRDGGRQDGGWSNAKKDCRVCGASDHRGDECRFRKYICGKCRQSGHLRRVCPMRSAGPRQRTGAAGRKLLAHVQAAGQDQTSGEDEPSEPAWNVESSDDDVNPGSRGSSSEVEEDMHQLCLNGYKPVSVTLLIDNIPIPMELDTGSVVSCISKKTYNKYFTSRPLVPSNLVLNFYDGTKVKPVGVIKPQIKYGRQVKALELFVIEGGTTSLLGRQWLSELQIEVPMLHTAAICRDETNGKNVMLLLDRYKELFTAGLGRFSGGTARLRVREGAVPVFCRARPLPYALRERVDAELQAMLDAGVIEPVDSSDWATPLVPVRKADGGLRICADYKVTLNPVLHVDRYPLPRIDDLLVGLNGAKVFSKIDLSQAYNQIILDDPDNLTVINTHRGLFKYKRLVYGLSSSPGIFQRIMSNLFSGIPNVEVFLDDVIIGSPNESEHLKTLTMVLERLHSNGMKLKKNKCMFLTEEVKYLGYIISKEGLKVDPEKIEAITKIPRPNDITQLRSFLGLINFYAKFVNNMSTIIAPLYELLRKGVVWRWDMECEKAFKNVKKNLTSSDVLTHYDPTKYLFLTCDASSLGIGGVLSQASEPGGAAGCRGAGAGAGAGERAVVYVSRALTSAEKHYSQIEREALAIVFCMEKLHQYLYGRQFVLRTDHKPLVTIFGSKQGIPTMAASRLQRWAIKLAAYTYDIEFVRSEHNGADGLSRLPISREHKQCKQIPEQTFMHFAETALLMDYREIKKQTNRDPALGRVLCYLKDGWPSVNEMTSLQPYFNRRKELYEELGCIMWGHRVVVPTSCRNRVLEELHEAHMGIVKTKAIARSYVWWPGVDEAVEAMCRECSVCAAEADAPPRQAPSPWPWPDKPWARVHLDFLGPIANKIYLVIIDARTKWLEVSVVPSTAACYSINRLSELFARWGVPKQIVSDNGPPFTSKEFSDFLKSYGVQHLFSAPYHPASNGAIENGVRTVKRAIKKAIRDGRDINLFLNNFLLHYRNTEHCTTGETPATLMLGRRLRTKLDALRPDREARVRNCQERQIEQGPSGTRQLKPGDSVWLRQYRGSDKWVPGNVTQKLGTVDYKVVDPSGRETHKHIDQLKSRSRSSLVCPCSPPRIQTPIREEKSEDGPSTSSSGSMIREERPEVVSSADGEKDDFQDCLEPVSVQVECSPQQKSPTEPPQPRPLRQCRLNKPKYKY